jgi:hypothetical protein
MIARYQEEAPAPMFLAGHFQSPPRNYHNSEKVKLDVQRDGRDIAVVVKDLSLGPNQNESNKFTSKEFTPPILDEEGLVLAWNQFDRLAGQDPFQDFEFVDKAMDDAFSVFRKLDAMIRRTTEVMASQVLRSGELELAGNDGTNYALNFQPKSSHFVTVGTPWGTTGAQPMRDVAGLAEVIRRDGKSSPAKLIFGEEALDLWLSDEEVKSRLDNRSMGLGRVAPEPRGQGATFQGWVFVGHYQFEMWSYSESYTHPVTKQDTPYVAHNEVLMLSSNGRLDLTFGGVPLFRRPENLAARFLPGRISDPKTSLDLTTNAYISPDGKRLVVGAAARPLTIPTGIDTFGRLTVNS